MPTMSVTTPRAIWVPSALAALACLPVTVISTMAGFLLLAYLPGRLLLAWLGVEDHWTAVGRTVLSVAVSWAAVPFALNPIWHLSNDRWVLLATVWLGATALAWFTARRTPAVANDCENGSRPFFERRSTVVFAAGVSIFLIAATVLPYWPTELFGYPVPAEMHDFIKHHAILSSLERRPLPIGNIFYAQGADGPVHYYHFFYLIPATVRLWTGFTLSHELAFGLASSSVALATAGVVFAVAKRFTGRESSATLSSALVTVIGSFDLFLYVPRMIERGRPLVMVDHWAHHPYIIHNFLFQYVWSPQNVLAVLVVLVGVYLLSARPSWRGWFFWGPLLGAAVLGSSVWVAMGTFPALGVWAMTRRRDLLPIAVVGLLTTLVCLPQIAGYAESATHEDRGLTARWPVNRQAVLGRITGPGAAANVLDLPVTLSLELGAKFLLLPLVPAVTWRRMWRDDGLRCLLLAAIISLGICTVVRVQLEHNDLRHKIVLTTMALAAILAGDAAGGNVGSRRWWDPLGWAPRPKRWGRAAAIYAGVLIVAGAITELYEAPLTATRRYVEDYLAEQSLDTDGRAQLAAEREAIRFMRHHLPPDATVQGEGTPDRARLSQMIRRQIGVMEPWDDILVFAPGDLSRYHQCVDELLGVLRTGESAATTCAVLRRYGVTHVFIGRVELDAWQHLERFDDRRYFTDAFRRDGIRVVRVEPVDAAPPGQNGSPRTGSADEL